MDSNPFDISKETKDNLNSNNRYMDSKQEIQMLAQEIAKEIVDKETMEKYGTSLNETMTHDYVKTLEKKYYELKRQFDTIDANSNSELTFDEVYDFFKDKTLPNSTDKIDRKYIERLFFLMDKDKNNRISIQEFVFAYIKLEEKLSLKRKKLINLLNELKDSKKQYEDKRKKTEDEKLNKDGICENASLSINLFEAKDLQPFAYQTSPSTFVVFSLDGKKQQSNLQSDTVNPIYDEDFTFPITKRGEVLKVEVYDQSTFAGTQLIGQASIDLVLYEHQQKTENWYSLSLNGETPDGQGMIHLRLRYIYNWNKYYTDLVKKTDEQINRLSEDILELDKYQELFQQPFGIIVAGEINGIIDKRMFEKSEDVLDYIASTRKSIYVTRLSSGSPSKKLVHTGYNPNLVEWKKSIKILLFASLFLSLLSFFTRSDFISLLMLGGVIAVVYRNNRNDNDTILKYLIYGMGGSIGFDCLWLMGSWGNWNTIYYENYTALFFTAIFALFNVVLKSVITFLLVQQNLKFTKQKQSEINKILNNNIR